MASAVRATAAQLTSYQVYNKVAQDATRNAIVEAIGTAVVYWVAGVWRPLAIAAFGIFTLTTLLDALQVVGLTSSGILVAVAGRRDPSVPRESKWMWAANIVRIGALALACYFLSVLYRRIWP